MLSYIDYCSEIQSTLRDQFHLRGFREPKGMLLIGRDKELDDDERKQKLKSAWNRVTKTSLEIRTYDALLRPFGQVVSYWEDLPKKGKTAVS